MEQQKLLTKKIVFPVGAAVSSSPELTYELHILQLLKGLVKRRKQA